MAAYQTNLEWNRWKRPVFEFGENEIELKKSILRLTVLKHMNINADKWDNHCQAIDEILNTIEQGVRKFANENFEGLKILGYVKQGSAQEGLKIENALEFDCKLLFDINQMITSEVRLRNSRDVDLLKLEVRNAENLIFRYQWIYDLEIFETGKDGKYYINTKHLQERVFKIIINKTRHLINDHLEAIGRQEYTMQQSTKPPTVGIDLTLDKETVMEDVYETFSSFDLQAARIPSTPMQELHIDIVPALVLYDDEISSEGNDMKCSVYAVMKWKNSPTPSENQYIWRKCSSGYEGFIFGQEQLDSSQLYMMTACRIVKSWIHGRKYELKSLRSVLESYHLKTACLHLMCMLKVDQTNTGNTTIHGVRQALGYFIYFLNLCIRYNWLPHFFYGNPNLHKLFPQCTFGQERIMKNLYANIHSCAMYIAINEYGKVVHDLRGSFATECELDKDMLKKIHKLLNVHVFFGFKCSTMFLKEKFNYNQFIHSIDKVHDHEQQ
ncbi:uncharacterized protein LOC143043764 [Mytilus galloprovincialis]|uniref:uncharacterized protein LOC143043764 n=1 Tax=Mytilus galloprovincialis TaxID=29158 RepID=UPI003F7CCFE4